MKVNIIGNVTELIYWYIANPDDTTRSEIRLTSGINTLPKSYAKDDGQTYNIGFAYILGDSEITIEQIPSFEGAFVTDGIDDLITSTKTVQEMLGGSNEITIVSMVHQVKDTTNNVSFTNYIRGSINGYFRNIVNNYGKTGIYGYTSSDLRSLSVINNILGDKNDYTSNGDSRDTIINGNFNVQGYSYNNSNNTGDFSSVAWYWTVIANKVLTTDQINQVIAYYNLDRTVKADIYCNITKQGITNENHAEFNDKLIDYSGNGRDIQMYNLAWKGGSGIGAKQGETIKDWMKIPDEGRQELIIYDEFKYKVKSNEKQHYWSLQYINSGTTSYPITIIADKDCFWSNSINLYDEEGNKQIQKKEIAISANTPTQVLCCGFNEFPDVPEGHHPTTAVTYAFLKEAGELTIEIIPSCKGGIILDGINDYGKVIGLPIYKDYTVVADYIRTFAKENAQDAPILSKSQVAGDGAFLFNYLNVNSVISSYSFGTNNVLTNVSDSERKIYYQSKYVNGGKSINSGTGTDYDSMWLGTYRDDNQIFFTGAIYSLMTFPYSMSEFLIERQLKKHKLGTLYPDMVEWRPIYTSNVNDYTITKATYFGEAGQRDLDLGNHYPIDTRFRIYVKPSGAVDEVTSIKVNGVELTYDYIDSNYGYAFNGTLSSKSPQKIDITIDEYIRYEDMDFTSAYPFVPIIEGYTWGDKLKVGDKVTYKVWSNMLTDLYSRRGEMKLNGENILSNSSITVEKSMKFEMNKVYLKSNEPKCILSPSRLRIPNSSYKILGYIPDISGHGNHGIIHNSAYAEGSGVNADGSYQLDGVDDFITIPTTVGGKQMLMKVNWQSSIGQGMLYDQRGTAFAIWNSDKYNDDETDTIPAYSARNGGNTYIDGILNKNILASQLRNITHNIVATNTMLNGSGVSPTIGCRTEHDAYFTNMSLYDFMLFDEISTDEEILTLNEYVGIEGNTDDLFN